TTGIIVLPVSFFLLSLASRYTHASNVSLLMLLETVLGPLWVWLGVGEAPTPMMLTGGTIVVVSLGLYILWTGRRRRMARLR
ncbi:MAG TPA: EamA/RhaT family transporter, partial [Roseovarius sp.]|nr:EamA/RhaT family transporter [Roseovarius sp.]